MTTSATSGTARCSSPASIPTATRRRRPGWHRCVTTTCFPPGACGNYPLPDGGCTRINLPTVHTIYPPVAEGVFALIRIVSFGRGEQFPLQLAAALGALAVAFLLARRGRPLWTVALWAWCPVTVIELGNNAHIDWLAVLLGVLALTASDARSPRRRRRPAGRRHSPTSSIPGLLGVVDAQAAPLVRRRRGRGRRPSCWSICRTSLPSERPWSATCPRTSTRAATATGISTGCLRWSCRRPPEHRLPLCSCVAVIVWALVRTDPEHPERTALIVMGVSILVVTPTLPWYTLLLLALAALARTPGMARRRRRPDDRVPARRRRARQARRCDRMVLSRRPADPAGRHSGAPSQSTALAAEHPESGRASGRFQLERAALTGRLDGSEHRPRDEQSVWRPD